MKLILLTVKDVEPRQSDRIEGLCIPNTCTADYVSVTSNLYVSCESMEQACEIITAIEMDGFDLEYRIHVTRPE